jgi:hypothetical protein
MTGPRRSGPEYTGKHRRDGGPGMTGPLPWGSRADSYGRPVPPDGRQVPGAAPMPGPRLESGFRPEPGPWADAG